MFLKQDFKTEKSDIAWLTSLYFFGATHLWLVYGTLDGGR